MTRHLNAQLFLSDLDGGDGGTGEDDDEADPMEAEAAAAAEAETKGMRFVFGVDTSMAFNRLHRLASEEKGFRSNPLAAETAAANAKRTDFITVVDDDSKLVGRLGVFLPRQVPADADFTFWVDSK